MQLITRGEIEKILPSLDLMAAIEAGFVAYSKGHANIPPVGELVLEKGEVHIKYGAITGDACYVIKIASGFYGNAELGLPSSNGLMLLFSQNTGELLATLLDEGILTDARTAVAGAIAAKHLAPPNIECIGIIGTGVQARLQLQYLQPVTTCKKVMVWGRNPEALEKYCSDMTALGYEVATTQDAAELGTTCNLIVTTTITETPILSADHIRPGTHISAIGSDTPHKQELDAAILARADCVVGDSIEQCKLRGEIFKALEARAISSSDVKELGNIISGQQKGRTSDTDITVFDSTGVAVQDIQIALATYEQASKS